MNRFKEYSIDWISVLIYILLISIGCLSIYSSSYNPNLGLHFLSINTLLGKQIFFITLALAINIFILLIDVRIILHLAYLAYFLSVFSLILVLMIGKEVGGAKAWFDFGKFGLQPAEFAKFGTILIVSKFIHNKNIYLKNLKDLMKISCFILIPCLLILMQPDAGSALIYGSLLIVFFREGLPLRYILSIIFIAILSLLTIIQGANSAVIFLMICSTILAYLLKKYKQKFIPILIFSILGLTVISSINYSYENILQPHQKERIDIILGKEKNDLGSGYNLNQSLIAIGSGGFLGKGYLKGTQTKFNFVPEQNTDFIFCTIGEEFGFLGSIFIIVLFSILIIRIFLLSEKQTSRFSRIFGYCVGSIFFGHIIINISMTIGLMPVIGIPLPFISAGGSSMIAFSMLLFTFIKLDTYRIERF
jgi:rod shape determining protein RodA